MHPSNAPEDSTLRRHYESAQRFQQQPREAPPAAASAPPPPNAPRSTETIAEPHAGGGFFGWLKRLFS